MSRAIVLVLCLAAAGGIAYYTYDRPGRQKGAPVYTVPIPSGEPAPTPPAPAQLKRVDPDDRAALARALQRELQRVGCYQGRITGVWSASSRLAMRSFVERVNATLPIDTPDPVLLSLVQGHRERACGAACPEGQTATGNGACLPSAVLAKTAKEPPGGTSDAETAGAAAALALTAPDGPPSTKAPAPAAARPAAATGSAPVPPEGMARRHRPRSRSAQAPAPPKIVKDFLRALGIE